MWKRSPIRPRIGGHPFSNELTFSPAQEAIGVKLLIVTIASEHDWK